ncbi:MAG: methyltransferase domain-containing protein [Dehalococcoidia bacterium]|nr:methyltransferase domain-containing protein [Dehalococcoidia bacterium]
MHGYSETENTRLADQANTLEHLLHHDSIFQPGSKVLEAGCGVGAQTIILAQANPSCLFTPIDISADSVKEAKRRTAAHKITNVHFEKADIFNLPFTDSSFDHVFICFILEHLSDPTGALQSVKRALKPGGSITVIEGDHGSAYYHPRSELAQATIQCLIDIQASTGGNALIGRELYPLLTGCGFRDCTVSPRVVYADAGRPEMADGFTRKTFIAMVEGVEQKALDMGLISPEKWQGGIADLKKAALPNGTFNYTFFKAVAYK